MLGGMAIRKAWDILCLILIRKILTELMRKIVGGSVRMVS
jgi:hypothetical protein